MIVRDKNLLTGELIKKLMEKGRQEKVPLWGAVAEKLNRPRRRGYEVNLFKIDKYANDGKIVIVPGSVLGTGEIARPLTVAALRFSRIAEEKIRKAGGKSLSIEKLLEEKHIKGARILG